MNNNATIPKKRKEKEKILLYNLQIQSSLAQNK